MTLRRLMHACLALPALGVPLATACKDIVQPPTTGAVRIAVTTTGGDLDQDGYGVTVDFGAPRAVGVNASVVVSGLAAVAHSVELGGVASNCSLSGQNPRSVIVTAGDTLSLTFTIACVATGVSVSTATTGIDLDLDGYAVSVDGGAGQPIVANGTVAITRLSAGPHVVALSGTAANCAIAGTNSRSVTVATGETAPVAFAVSCGAVTGALQITSITSGLDLDPDNYSLQVDNAAPQALALNATANIAGVAGGDHSVTLSGLAGNCTASGTNPRTLHVTTGGATRDTARATFQVTCGAKTGSIRVTVATSGVDLDPSGYSLKIDGARASLTPNAVLTFDNLAGGDHTVSLDSVAVNCAVGGGNPRTLTLTTGGVTRDTARTTYQVSCVRVQKIALESSARITVVYADGSNVVFLGQGVRPAWSPDGTKLVFTGMECDYYYGCYSNGLWVMNGDGTGVVRLTSDNTDGDAAWRRNGTRIAFTRYTNGRYTLYAMNPDGSGATAVGIPDSVKAASQPGWSPDGTKLAFTCEVQSGNTDICTVNADGTGLVRLTSDAGRDAKPAWKPDGSRIAFSTTRFSGSHEIALMNPDGTGVTRLATGTGAFQPAWSPDGAKIAFASFVCDIYYGCSALGLSVINSDGTGLTKLSGGSDYAPAWRP